MKQLRANVIAGLSDAEGDLRLITKQSGDLEPAVFADVLKSIMQKFMNKPSKEEAAMSETLNPFEDVLAFHRKFGCQIGRGPTFIIPQERKNLREDLINEERDELTKAMDENDPVEIADACADLIYVVIGTAIEYGIDLVPVWNEVQRANMAKEGGGEREDGKILKPDGWQPPDIQGCLRKQEWLT